MLPGLNNVPSESPTLKESRSVWRHGIDYVLSRLASTASVADGSGRVATKRSATGSVELKLSEWIESRVIHSDEHGAVGNDTADDTSRLQSLFDAAEGRTCELKPNAVFKCTSGVTAKGNVRGNGATLKFYGTTIETLVSQSTEGSLVGFTIDGDNVTNCSRGLLVNTDFDQTGWCYYDLAITNISNGSNTGPAEGANFFRGSGSARTTGFFDVKMRVSNITATANGINGDTPGSAMGIGFSFNASGTDVNVVVHDSVVTNVSPAEDAIGIYCLTADHTSSTAKGTFVLRDCSVYDSAKYAFKIQAPNAVLRNCKADNANVSLSEAFTTYGYRTLFDKCTVLNQNGEGFAVHAPNATIRNCLVRGNSSSIALNVHDEGTDFRADGLDIYTAATFANNDFVRVAIGSAANARLDKVSIFGTTDTGTAIQLTGASVTVTFTGLVTSGFHYGVQFPYGSTESWWHWPSVSATVPFFRLGNTSNPTYIRGGKITSTSTAFLMTSGAGANAATLDCDGAVITASTNGIVGPSGCRTTNCTIISPNTTGYAIVAGDSVARNNQIKKFATGIGIAFTTTAEMANNVTIGTTTPYETTGYTIFVNNDNSSR